MARVNMASQRRSVLKATGALSVGAIAGCLGSNDDGGSEEVTSLDDDDEYADSMRFYGWGGSWNEAWMVNVAEPFEEKYGTTIEPSGFADEDDMFANMEASPEGEFDIVCPSLMGIYEGTSRDLFEPINTDLISTWENLLPTFQDFEFDMGDETHVTPSHYGTRGMAYNSNEAEISDPPSWGDVYRDEYDDQITLRDDASTRVYTTALYLGHDPNAMDNDEFDEIEEEIFDTMAEHHEMAVTYWASGEDFMNVFTNEEAIIGDGWGGRIQRLREEGFDHLHYVLPEEGALSWVAGPAVAKGSTKKKTAMKFMEFVLQPEIHANLVADGEPSLGYGPTTDVVTDGIEELAEYDPSGGQNLYFENPEFVINRLDDWQQTFDQIKTGNY